MAGTADIGGLLGTAGGSVVAGPIGAAVGGGLGSIVGGLFGGSGPSPYDIWKAQMGRMDAIDLPTLQALINAGQIDSSALANLEVDPTGRLAQTDALQGLQGVYKNGGADVISRSAQAQLLDRAAQQERSDREAIMQEMAQRGQSGGGAELAARLQGQQNQYRGNAMSGAQLAGDDRMRALQAMTQAGQLGTNVRSQDFDQAATRAQAADMLNQWNARNRSGAYTQRTNWDLAKASGMNIPSQGMAQGAQENYTRGTNMGGAAGTMAGGVYDWYRNRQNPTDNSWSGEGSVYGSASPSEW